MKKVITGHDGQGKSVFFKVESDYQNDFKV